MEPYGRCFGGRFMSSPSGKNKKKLPQSWRAASLSARSGKRYPLNPRDYKVYEEVGVGSSGTVYRALCVPFKEIVAIKVVDLDKSSATPEEMCYEVQTMAMFDHPNILRVHCSFVVDYNLWIVMPYMNGGSCLHLMETIYLEGFKEPVVGAILQEVLEALHYLHLQGQTHRNVKAGNILVDANGAVLLNDVGVSTCTFDIGNTRYCRNSAAETSLWMPPEVKEQQHIYGPKVDIWSFGITALELSQGHASIMKHLLTKTSLQRLTQGNDYERHKRLSKPFQEMIAKCLRKNPAKRPSAEKLLKHSFFKNAPSSEVAAQTVFNGLPCLGDQLQARKLKAADILEEKKVPNKEKEDQSQSQHQRAISAWNLDLEDLKIQDNDEIHSMKVIEHSETMEKMKSMVKIESIGMENDEEDGDCTVQVQPSPLEASISVLPSNGLKGHGDILEGNTNPCSTPEMESIRFDDRKLVVLQSQKDDASMAQANGHALEEECNLLEESHNVSEQSPKVCSESQPGEKSSRHQHQPKLERNSSRSSSIHRTNATPSVDSIYNQNNTAGNPENSGEKSNGPAVQTKGRFTITSENVEPEQTMSQASTMHFSTSSISNVAVSPMVPLMQSISECNAAQREHIINLIKSLSQATTSSVCLPNLGSKASSCIGLDISMFEACSDRERELLQDVFDLRMRATNLADEIQKCKMKNIQLERQLSSFQQR